MRTFRTPFPSSAPAPAHAAATLVLALVALLVPSVPATASHRYVPPAVRRLDREIHHAEHQIKRWDHRLARWQIRVSKAAARVQNIMALPPQSPPPPIPVSNRMVQHHRPPAGVLVVTVALRQHVVNRVARAHRALQRVLRDHRAKEAQQQAEAWQAYLSELRAARVQALAVAHGKVAIGSSGPLTFQRWATALLGALGAPTCDQDVVVVVTWETAESTMATYNPLATTYDMPGASFFNQVGVKNYVSFAQGIEASRNTLLGGTDSLGYALVVSALRACAPATVTASAIRDSAWCRGCGDGAYVLGLLPEVRASWAEHASRLISSG
jgi:hypothetical protein